MLATSRKLTRILRRWGPKAYPIGIDLGSSSLKILQLAETNGRLTLAAAAKVDVPQDVRLNRGMLHRWHIGQIRRLLGSGDFKGKKAVTCLPADRLLVQHLRLPKMEQSDFARALAAEARERAPFDPDQGMIRHIVVGEVCHDGQQRQEVILMAASAESVAEHIDLIEKTGIEPGGIGTEFSALAGCFANLLDRPELQDSATMLVDLGYSRTKVMVCHGKQVAFSRAINVTLAEAAESVGVTTPGKACASSDSGGGLAAMLEALCGELRSCVRYHDSVFAARSVQRVIFLGGMAKNTALAERLARGLGLPAQLGDPLARITSEQSCCKNYDFVPGQRHCEWAVAYGLSLERP